jgi:thiamine biosynthesis lipoprotein
LPFNRPLILLLLILLLTAAWWRLQPEAGTVQRTQLLMGTTVSIEAAGADTAGLERAITAAFAEIARIETLMSPHRSDSDVSRLTAAEHMTTVAPETAEVIALGLEIARRSGGAFDLTLGRLNSLWGIETETPRVPAPAELAAALQGIGPGALTVSGNQVTKSSPQLAIELGAIAKGYAVDRAIATLRAHGVSSAAVNAGGDIGLLGSKQGRPWRVGVQHPRQASNVLVTLAAADRAVVTSGDYERYFERDGRRYHHLFDPHTGYPAGRCQSVTVLAPRAVLADALATALFVLGPERGLALLRDYPDVDALIVAADGRLHSSPGLAAARAEPL